MQRKTERTQLLGSGDNLIALFAPVIPEIISMEITKDEIQDNLTRGGLDLYDVYQHRTACATCNFTDYHTQCIYPLQNYFPTRNNGKIHIWTKWRSSCKAKDDPYKLERIEELLKQLGTPKELKDKTINKFEPANEYQHRAKDKCVKYVQEFKSFALQGEGLLLTGPTGTGKTHLAVSLAKGVITQHQRSVKFVDVGTWAHDFVYGSRSFEEKKRTIDSMKKAELLILDDLGAELELQTQKSTVTGAINLVIMYRYNEAKPTVFTTNLQPEGLELHLGKRAVSRLREKNITVPVTGKDNRIPWVDDWSDIGTETDRKFN